MTEITPQELKAQLDGPATDKLCLVDVRQPEEFAIGHLPGARLIPLGELGRRMDEIPEGVEIVAYCHHGIRSAQAVGILALAGREARSLHGGTELWSRLIDPTLPRY
jgi:sulfur-carrier protein adenylyltransferase/sulfurtransferase